MNSTSSHAAIRKLIASDAARAAARSIDAGHPDSMKARPTAFVEETDHRTDSNPAAAVATRERRRARARELDAVNAVAESGGFFGLGHRSATDWLATTTHESVGHCKMTLSVASRIQAMPIVRAAFADGLLAESSLRLLIEAWHPNIADVFARDEQMLCGWATTMGHRDFAMVLDVWRMRADPDREERSAQDDFDDRALHISRLLDGVGRIDGTLDPEALALIREAVRAYSQPGDGETRTAAQRRHDALVSICKLALEQFVPEPGRKRRKPKVIATIAYDDLVDAFLTTLDDDEATGTSEDDAPKFESIPTDQDDEAAVTPTSPTPHGAGPRPPRSGSPTGTGATVPAGGIAAPGGTIDTDLDRIVVGAETIRRMACDCNVHRYVSNPQGTVVGSGRAHRVVSDTLFDTLLIRDHGCRWPGCGIPAGGCDAHHAKHWLDLGETKPDNLVLLCWSHHHLLHDQHWSMCPLGGGHFTLNSPHGESQPLRPPLVGLTLPTLPTLLAQP